MMHDKPTAPTYTLKSGELPSYHVSVLVARFGLTYVFAKESQNSEFEDIWLQSNSLQDQLTPRNSLQ